MTMRATNNIEFVEHPALPPFSFPRFFGVRFAIVLACTRPVSTRRRHRRLYTAPDGFIHTRDAATPPTTTTGRACGRRLDWAGTLQRSLPGVFSMQQRSTMRMHARGGGPRRKRCRHCRKAALDTADTGAEWRPSVVTVGRGTAV